MSTPTQFHMFLPNYILEYVVCDETSSKIDPDLFLSKATTSQIVEVIVSFYPHLRFTEDAQQDHELILKIFVEMIAPRLSNVIIPLNHTTDYLQAALHNPLHDAQPLIRWVTCSADIDTKRIQHFEMFCLANLKNRLYRLAAEDIEQFVKTYKYLNEAEVNEILNIQDDADEALNNATSYLRGSHESIESIQLLLRNPNLSPADRQHLDERLRCTNALLVSHQKMFDGAILDVAFVQALGKYHKEILAKHTARVSN
ncbi:hypothetical protein DFH28DRAFT_1133005 [Melampsora americana]|nr:hypothetical protein DFH28DRAFT_1133005 [Melampsora americana]